MLPEGLPPPPAPAIHKAKELARESGTQIEKDLIEAAMLTRYAPEHEGDEQRLELDKTYAAAMEKVWRRSPRTSRWGPSTASRS